MDNGTKVILILNLVFLIMIGEIYYRTINRIRTTKWFIKYNNSNVYTFSNCSIECCINYFYIT